MSTEYIGDISFVTESIDYTNLLTPGMASVPFYANLMTVWSTVMHNVVTEPRRELSRIRSLFRRDLGDYFILTTEQLDTVTAALESVELEDRGLPPLLLDEGELDPRILPEDTINITWDVYNTDDTKETYFANIIDRVRVSRDILIKNSSMLGFEFLSDELSTEGYWRLSQFTAQYWEESSTYGGLNFLAWILNARLKVEALWTRDGENFRRRADIERDLTSNMKYYYPTSRVILLYDAEKNPNIDLDKLRELFLIQAPINVVLEEIIAMPLESELNIPSLAGSLFYSKYFVNAE